MSSPYLQHLLLRLHADLAFLHSQGHIDQAALDTIQSRLPPSAAQTEALDTKLGALNVGEGEKKRCRALWDHPGNQSDDLPFAKGDVIVINQEMNSDWWSGSFNGRTGLFPSNYVERIDASAPATSAPPPPLSPPPQAVPSYNAQDTYRAYPDPNNSWNGPGGNYAQSYNAPYQQHNNYQQAPPFQPYQQAPQAPYDPYAKPPESYVPPPPPTASSSTGPPPPIPPKKKFNGGKLGGLMATSFAGGIGFGAGSAVASEAIHAIF